MLGYGVYNNGCLPCSDSNCIDCSTDYTVCLQCKIGFGPDSGGSCTLCSDSNCLDCSNNFNVCNYCRLTYYNIGTCQLCSTGCARCLSLTSCQACILGYGLIGSTHACGPCPSHC